MATVNIPLEIPADSLWDADDFVACVKEYARKLLANVPKVRKKSPHERWVAQVSGGWDGPRTAEEIMADIRSTRFMRVIEAL